MHAIARLSAESVRLSGVSATGNSFVRSVAIPVNRMVNETNQRTNERDEPVRSVRPKDSFIRTGSRTNEPTLGCVSQTLFWSGTREVAHQMSGGCYQTLEDTMLGSVLDGKTWCGKQGSNETFDSGCPNWTQCVNNPVRSFWSRASAEFAAVACGDAAVLLNGSSDTPFDPHCTFGSIEVKNFTPGLMKSLTVVLVTKDNVGANCTDESLKNLQKELKPGMKYICKEKTESELLTCRKNQDQSCVPCW
ncbi:unnamed protein product [Gadus morhua 'NCC']